MGKNKKKQRKSAILKKSVGGVKVSVVTPTTANRKDIIKLLLEESLLKQTHPLFEWIVVSGDTEWDADNPQEEFEKYFREITKDVYFKVTLYFANEENAKKNGFEVVDNYGAIGYLRNMTNKFVTGDIIVCFDDDDYYCTTRIQHAVEKLTQTNDFEVAGCSPHILYDTDLETLYQFKKVHSNHSINSVLCYKRSYLDKPDATYDSTKTFAEEQTFLNRFTVPVLQLDPKQCVVQMIHSNNTFNKRKIIFNAHWLPNEKKNVFILSKDKRGVHSLIPKDTLDKYLSVLVPKTPDVYDIVYYLGSGSVKWLPTETNLGGSEQAVKHLAISWAKLGLSVAVYGDFGDDNGGEIYDVVDENTKVVYKNYGNFSCAAHHRLLVLWRNYGIFPLMNYKVHAKKVVYDVHDNIRTPDVDYDKLTGIMVRSNFHQNCMKETNKHISSDVKYFSILNGVRVKDFTPGPYFDNDSRDPFRFCWCSCYTRGLQQILMWLFPVLKQLEPRVSLHVYYGMNQVKHTEFKNMMNHLLSQPGVVDHGRQNLDKIIEEKQKASFHLYFSKTKGETDCISVRESACAGCIPIMSHYGVFQERNGLHIDGDPNQQKDMYVVAHKIAALLKNPQAVECARKELQGKELDWDSIASKWLVALNI